MASNLMIHREGNLVIAIINRPEKLNAMGREFFIELERLVDVLETDKTADALLLTGAGEKAFCVGADLKERQGMNEKDILQRMEKVATLYHRLENLPVPVIAAVNGMALGGGLELALACDFRIVSELAVLGLPEVSLAIIPGNGGTQRLPRLVGMAKALELILMARRITAHEAYSLGMVHHVTGHHSVVLEAKRWANKISEAGPIAVRSAKRAIREGMNLPLREGICLETEAYKECLYSKDRIEGIKAFSEKRKPVYQGV